MSKYTFLRLVLCTGVLTFLISSSNAQPVQITIRATDGQGSDSVRVGHATNATNNVDAALGEEEYPPAGPTFDFRSVRTSDNPGKDTIVDGLKKNIHRQIRPTQTDRWRLAFKSDAHGTAIHFEWDAGLASMGGGGWLLIDDPGIDDEGYPKPERFSPVDMTQVTSFSHPVMDTVPQYAYIKTFDARRFRSIPHDSIALSRNEKNQSVGKPVQRKVHKTNWCFTFTNNTGQAVGGLHVEFDQAVDVLYAYSPFTTAIPNPKKKVYDFSGGLVPDGQTVTICGLSFGKKANKCKFWWTDNGAQIGAKQAKSSPDPGTSVLRLPMPNYWNVLEELYAQGAFSEQVNGKNVGLRVGMKNPMGTDSKGKPIVKSVIHPKYNDVFKTLFDKKAPGFVHSGTQKCLTEFEGGKGTISKEQKSLPPTKHNNRLLAEAVALKISIAASDYGKLPTGLGNLVFDDGSSPLSGQTVRQISAKLDTALSCYNFSGASPKDLATITDYYTAVNKINTAFVGPFDTVRFGAGTKSPPALGGFGFTELTGAKAVAEVSYLYRPEPVVPPRIEAEYRFAVNELPRQYTLAQNYPNPFNPSTTIEFELSEDALVILKVYNMLGQEVATLMNGEEISAGLNWVDFDASELASGVYYYRLVVNDGEFHQARKMMLLK